MPPLPAVLIVEDDAPTRVLLASVCRRNHLEPTLVGDGRTALERLRMNDYDVVLLDLRIPHVTGIEVLTELATIAPHLLDRVVVVTAAAETTYCHYEILHSVRNIVRKPFELEQLEGQLLACLFDGERRKSATR